MTTPEVDVAEATSEELVEYVTPTWLGSYCLGFVGQLMRADSRRGVGREIYWQAQREKIARILAAPTRSVRVAHVDGEPVAWVCDDRAQRLMHYVFVNRVFRRQGIAGALMPTWFTGESTTARITHLPPPFFSRRLPGDTRDVPMRPHMVVDLISPL